MRGRTTLGISIVLLGVMSVAYAVPPKTATMILKEGDSIGGATVSTTGTPFVNGLGQIGMMVRTVERDYGIYYNGSITFWADSVSPDVLTGTENNLGIGDNGEWIYSPSYNGDDSAYSNEGLLLARGMPSPGLPSGTVARFNSRPYMIDDGTAYWIGGYDTGTEDGRVMYRKAQGGPIEVVLTSDDIIDGYQLYPETGVDFDFHVSPNGAHRINTFKLVAGTSNEMGVFINDTLVAREGTPSGQGDNWDNFDSVFVNNSGHYLFSGDTDGASTADEFLAFDGTITLNESQTVDDIALEGMSVKAVDLNNLNQAVHIWGKGFGSSAQEHVFFGSADDLANSTRLLSIGDEIDIDDDGVADYLITDFLASNVGGYGFEFGVDGNVYLEVDMEPIGGGDEIEGVIGLVVPEPSTLSLLGLGLLALRRRR